MSGRVVGPRTMPDPQAAGTALRAASGPAGRARGFGASMIALLLAGLQLIFCTLAVVIGSAAYWPFFAGFSFLLPVAGAAVLGTLGGVAIVRWRRPPGLAWALSLVAFLLYAVYALFPDSTSSGLPGLGSLAAVGDGLLGGLARMLTVVPPADVQGELLILPAALAFAAALASALSCAGRSVLLPVLPPLLVFVCALLLSANAPEFRWRTTLAFLGCVLVIVLLRANPVGDEPSGPAPAAAEGARSPGRANAARLLFGLPVVIGVTLLAVVATGALPVADGAQRYDPRAQREAPLDIQDQLNPLVGVREQRLMPAPAEVFTVQATDGVPIPFERIRAAALDTYDGVQWRSSARFVRTGSTLPAGPAITDPATITIDVTLADATPSPFLPELGRPIAVEATNIGFDPATGLLATGSPALGGYRYRVTGQYPAPAIDPGTAVPDPAAVADASLTTLPPLPDDPAAPLRTLAQKWSAGATTPYERLTAIADQLRQFSYARDAAPGHSFAALRRFVAPEDPAVDHRVTEEQTAAAFAIMARTLGYPARVAVGYRLDPQQAADGTVTVTTDDADAWAEVAFAGRGWEQFQVTPAREGDPPPPPPQVPQGNDQGTVTPTAPGGSGSGGAGGTSTVATAVSWAIALAVLLPLLLLIAAIGAIVAAKQWRRKRRSTNGSAADRVLGAWREAMDRLTEHGLSITPDRTPTDVARAAAERFGPDAGRQVGALAPIVSHALYAQNEPDEVAVAAAWDLEAELRSILDRLRPWWAGALSWADPRPLWRGPHRRATLRQRGDRSGRPPAGPSPAEPPAGPAGPPVAPEPVGSAP